MKYNLEFWDKLLKEYYTKHGNIDMPHDYITEDGYKLGRWISRKRHAFRNNTIKEDEYELLNNYGIIWMPRKEKWEYNYEGLRKYHEKYHNIFIQNDYIDEEGRRLGLFIRNMRNAYYGKFNLIISDEQIKKLDELGMIWDPNTYKLLNQKLTKTTLYGKKVTLLRKFKKYLEEINDLEITSYSDIININKEFEKRLDYKKRK